VRTASTASVAVRPPPPEPPKETYSLSHPPPITGPSSDARVREAEELLRAGKFAAAGKLLAELRELLPGSVEVWVLSGMLATELDHMKEAAGYVDKALQLDAKYYRAWVLKGFIHQSGRRAARALECYRRALAIDPGHAMSPELRSVADRLERDGLD
jgi:tetratricopeptide (TPR) repeat protein